MLQDATVAGYQWKQVFLPEGTVLRTSFGGQPWYAVVEGAEIKYGQYCLSPSAFANLQGSGNRNAWKAVWLRFPNCPSTSCCKSFLKQWKNRSPPLPPAASSRRGIVADNGRHAGRNDGQHTAYQPECQSEPKKSPPRWRAKSNSF